MIMIMLLVMIIVTFTVTLIIVIVVIIIIIRHSLIINMVAIINMFIVFVVLFTIVCIIQSIISYRGRHHHHPINNCISDITVRVMSTAIRKKIIGTLSA